MQRKSHAIAHAEENVQLYLDNIELTAEQNGKSKPDGETFLVSHSAIFQSYPP